jgi:hypothetical protein
MFQSEAFWIVLSSVLAYLANSIVSVRVARLAPTSPWRRAIRVLHGVLNKVDPEGNEPSVVTKTVAMLALFFVTLGCVPVGAPARTAAAVDTADTTLAVAILTETDRAPLDTWEQRVHALEITAAIVRVRCPECDVPDPLRSRLALDAVTRGAK